MSRRLLIECGVAQTIGVLCEGEEPLRFWFRPVDGDPAPGALEAGEIVFGRITKIMPALKAAFVDVGGDRDAFLPLTAHTDTPTEGAMVTARVRRRAVGRKGPVLSLDWRDEVGAARLAEIEKAPCDKPGRAPGAPHPAVLIAHAASAFQPASIILDNPDSAHAIGGGARVDADAVANIDIESALDAALMRTIEVTGGARLIFDESEGACVVDLDAGANADRGGATMNDQLNAAAVKLIFRELARRAIAGRVIVDFLPPLSAMARAAFKQALARTDAWLYPRRAGNFAADGLFDMTAQKDGPSLLERASEPTDDGALRPGRRFNIDWTAKMAVGAAERRLRRAPSARLSLLVAPLLADYISERMWMDKLSARYGARLTLKSDTARKADRFEIAE